MKKGQAALEFLSTYAWAFLVILGTLGVLYYFGFLNFTSFAPDICLFPPQFPCLDFSVSEDAISLRLVNDLGEGAQMTSILFSSVDNDAPNCDIQEPVVAPLPTSVSPYLWQHTNTTDFRFDCTPGVNEKGDRFEYIVTFSYYAANSPSQREHIVRGKVSGKVI